MKKEKASLKCPHCGEIVKVEIPKDRCLVFLKCEKCQKLIKTPEGKCCVVCAYSNRKCPVSSK